MTSHAPAIPRRLIDITALLDRVRRKAKRPEDDMIGLHIHDRPIIIMKTTAGDFPAILLSACLFDGQMTCNFVFVAPTDLTVIAMIQRHGTHEAVVQLGDVEQMDGKLVRGRELRVHIAFRFGIVALIADVTP